MANFLRVESSFYVINPFVTFVFPSCGAPAQSKKREAAAATSSLFGWLVADGW
jgi:hypothetical protein